MSQTDPIAEMLTTIRNAARARYNEVEVSHSRLREAICRTLQQEGFLEAIDVSGEIPKKRLRIRLRFSASRTPVIQGLSRVSRPSLRRYAGAAGMPREAAGLGVHVVSTPLGVMTDREARRRRVGGEILVRVW